MKGKLHRNYIHSKCSARVTCFHMSSWWLMASEPQCPLAVVALHWIHMKSLERKDAISKTAWVEQKQHSLWFLVEALSFLGWCVLSPLRIDHSAQNTNLSGSVLKLSPTLVLQEETLGPNLGVSGSGQRLPKFRGQDWKRENFCPKKCQCLF